MKIKKVCIIPALEKNIYSLQGDLVNWGDSTLIEWKIAQAIESKIFDQIIISTTSEKIINIAKTPINWGSKKWAINNCINNSNGEIILQTDADCIHGKDWIFEMAQPFQNYDIGFVCGPSYIGKKSTFWDLILKLESISQESFTYANSKKNLYISCTARNIAFKKSLNQIFDNLSQREMEIFM